VATKPNDLPDTRSYALADFDAMEQKLEAGQKLDPNFVDYFFAGLKKLKEVPRQLFSEGMPRLSAMQQRWTSDCYFAFRPLGRHAFTRSDMVQIWQLKRGGSAGSGVALPKRL
jgi:hypothetical protein